MECQVYQAIPAAELAAGPHAYLDEAERERWQALRRAADRTRFATAAVLLRTVAGWALKVDPTQVRVVRACPDCDRAHGRPMVPDSDLQVSMSHAGDVVLVALTRGSVPIGVDVEQIDRVLTVDDFVRFALAPAERERIRRVDGQVDQAAFFRIWTRKEAILKATGDGLRVPMSSLTLTPEGGLLEYPGRPGFAARIVGFDTGTGYAAALAALTDDELVIRHVAADRWLTQSPSD